MGGIAIYLTFAGGFLFYTPHLSAFYPIMLGATILFATGLIDDLIQLKPYIKLVMQLIAASIVVYGGLRMPWTSHQSINDLLTIFWLVGITNAINLLDNMDGLAGGISLIACIFLAINFAASGQSVELLLPLIMIGAIAGFLVFNFNPASIFMGDCGALFLGFSLGGIALMSGEARTRNLAAVLLTPVLIFIIPILDTSIVTVTRKLSGRAVSQGGRDHTSHRLVALGMSERRAVILLYLVAIIAGIIAVYVRQMRIGVTVVTIAGFALAILFIGLLLGKVKVYDESEHPGGTLIDVIQGFTHRRRIFENLLDMGMIVLAYYVAYLIRWDGDIPPDQRKIFAATVPLMIGIELFAFLAGGVYRGIWRYAGIDELVTIAKSTVLGSGIAGMAILSLYRFNGPSRGVMILNGILIFLMVAASRVSFRFLGTLLVGRRKAHPDARPVLIYGAGDGGAMLIGELLNNPAHQYEPLGFIDDDRTKTGKLLRGYQIFHSRELPDLIEEHGVTEVLISSLKVGEERLEQFKSLGIEFRRMRIHIE
ncbi:MAG: hypothetical protein IPG76_22600 [Acidobacteria bacterium]|nr:hypothetical protein [Acidobacteriota bacterium]